MRETPTTARRPPKISTCVRRPSQLEEKIGFDGKGDNFTLQMWRNGEDAKGMPAVGRGAEGPAG